MDEGERCCSETLSKPRIGFEATTDKINDNKDSDLTQSSVKVTAGCLNTEDPARWKNVLVVDEDEGVSLLQNHTGCGTTSPIHSR